MRVFDEPVKGHPFESWLFPLLSIFHFLPSNYIGESSKIDDLSAKSSQILEISFSFGLILRRGKLEVTMALRPLRIAASLR